jgi:hypothetical protein
MGLQRKELEPRVVRYRPGCSALVAAANTEQNSGGQVSLWSAGSIPSSGTTFKTLWKPCK